MAVKLNKHDLEFILKQIKIAEAHSSGIPLNEIRVDENGVYGWNGQLAISQPHLPYGLRTVDGTYNNIIPGRELWGAADQTMPRMFDPNWRNETDTFDRNGEQPGGLVDNDSYDSGGLGGDIADADPRIISNLIADQTPNNPAALIAALRYAGHEGDLTAKMASVTEPFSLLHAAHVAQARVDSWQKMLDDLNAVIATTPPNQAMLESVRDDTVLPALGTAQTNAAAAIAAAAGAQEALDVAAADLGIEFEVDGRSLRIPNVAPDEGLSAPFNGWMTFFGQFFDHGLDLISKGGDGTIYVPLQPDDPLYVPGGFTNFMVLTRATQVAGPGEDGILGTADDTQREAVNVTTPFVDQNQTYTSHPSHQVFLREYELDAEGKPVATGRLLDGASGGLPTWKDVKENALNFLGIELTDRDVFNIPLIRTDLYGKFIPHPDTGFAQIIINIGPDGIPNTSDDITMSGTPGDPVRLNPNDGGIEPARTSHSFLDDIAHNAVPVLDTQGLLITDGTNVPDTDPAGNAVQFNPLTGRNTEYDNELLDAHFVTGDGRGNENIGLTAVHHVFHSEHNRQVAVTQLEILKTKDLDFINEWLLTDLTQEQVDSIPTGGLALAEHAQTLNWDGERLFQTARFATEMQYQHLVFEEFGRKVQPMIDAFVFNTITDIDPAIFAEFAHVVYRFGHSMLTEEVKRMFLDSETGEPIRYDENGNAVSVGPDELGDWAQDIGLIESFLNPIEFDKGGTISHDQAAGAIFRGMTLVHGNEIDEFVVDALRNNLLGLPLDLASINIARGRDTGMPTLNQARAQLYEASSSTFVKPYESWSEFAANLKNPASVVNFIAAYGTHASIQAEQTIEGKRAAATALVMGVEVVVTIDGQERTFLPPSDRLNFLNSTDAGVGGTNWSTVETGLNHIDLWIGGLAEKKMPFGGMLGSTFNAVFEAQLEMLQDLDRFYYLTRTQGLNLLNELENNAFSKMVAANSDMTDPGPDGIVGTDDDIESPFRTGVDPFAKHDYVLNIDPDKQIEADPEHDDAALNAIGMTKVQRDNLLTGTVNEAELKNYIRFIGGEHAVIGGSAGDDTIISDFGDDAIWGGAGNDRIESGAGVDFVIGGSGNDIITDSGDTGDFIKGEDGDDVIANSNGLDVLMGGDGKDVFFVGVDATEVFGGEGDDFILGGADADFLMGNEGDDWIEGGDGFDVLSGENSELFFNSSIIGHDVLFAGENENDFDAESGDDIMVQGESVMRNEGMFGFDWAIHKGNRIAADSDMRIPIFTTVADDILRDRFDQTEALSGWMHNDVLRGDDRGSKEEIEVELDMTNHELTQAGVNRIDGLRALLGNLIADAPTGNDPATGKPWDLEKIVAFKAGNILIGGDGNDTIEGRGGDDFIHGDAWLNVRIRITAAGQENTAVNEIATVDTLKHVFTQEQVDAWKPVNPTTTEELDHAAYLQSWVGKSLYELMTTRVIVPNQMHIVREILYDEDPSNSVDTAIFAGNKDWYEITEFEDGSVRVARREMEEVDPQIDEGTDTLVGIERIQFADQTVVLQQSGNHEPVGRLTLTGLPARENQMLTVSAENVYDANNPGVAGVGNVGTITYRWQIERNDGTGDYINIPGAFGNTFTPGDEHTGLRIRVVGTYVDAGGVTETVMSLSTDIVIGENDEPVGPLLISDTTPTLGQQLTATVAFTDPDGITDAFEEGLLTYQWEYSTNGGNSWAPATPEQATPEFTPASEHVGAILRVVVRYTDDLANNHIVVSAPTSVVGTNLVASGNASASGTAGDDIIVAIDPSGSNTLEGLGGSDVILGGGGDDTLDGGEGADVLTGGTGADNVDGGAGDDTLIYHEGDGVDTLTGGDGTDTLSYLGTSGDDHLSVAYDGNAITGIEDGTVAGIENVNAEMFDSASETDGDTLDYGATSTNGVNVNLLTGSASGFSYIRNIENVIGTAAADTIQGDNDPNRLVGNDGADTLRGGFGGDRLEGGGGDDRLYGEAGDDVLVGGDSTSGGSPITGYDRLDGGAGVDTASYVDASAAVTVDLSLVGPQNTSGAGNDWLIDIENLIGSNFSDTLTGNNSNNVLDGGGGAGGDSDDLMIGLGGDDTYIIDDVSGALATQRDRVVEAVGGGNDTLMGSVAIDLNSVAFVGQEIENIVLIGDGNFAATGNDLDNRITGNSGNNLIDGGLGNDIVVLTGQLTNTSFTYNNAQADLRVNVGQGTDRLHNIEGLEIDGVVYNLIEGGTNDANTLNGTNGDDILAGVNGADTLIGGDGNDILVGGNGADSMTGGAGNDVYFVNDVTGPPANRDQIFEGAGPAGGIDTVHIFDTNETNTITSYDMATLAANVENLVAVGDTARTIAGNGENNDITTGSGNDVISGAAGNDILRGGAGDDELDGGEGDDDLIGGEGDDDLIGGAGTDTAVFAGKAAGYSFAFDVTGTVLTIDDIDSSDGDEGSARLLQMGTTDAIERVQFADQTFVVNTGDDGDNTIVVPGGVGQIILGRGGTDEIRGSTGNDIIIGGAGDDLLFGSDLPDGDNAVIGDLDDDTFIWNAGDGSDTINGGFEGAGGDLLVINGNAEAEIYRIYTIDEAIARIAYEDGDVGGDFEAEIVITRQVGAGGEIVIAAMTDIEEIIINGTAIAGSGQVGNDTVQMFGDFSLTSLRPETITVVGGTGDDTVDISSLLSAHRIVFKTKGGNDIIIGTLRPQDVIEFPDGSTISDYQVETNENGSFTVRSATHSVTFFSTGGLPQFGNDDGDDDETLQAPIDDDDDQGNSGGDDDNNDDDDDDNNNNDSSDDDDDDDDSAGDDDDDSDGVDDEGDSTGTGGNVTGPGLRTGTPQGDVLIGTAGSDNIVALAGDDVAIGDGGADTISAGDGADFVDAGSGRDVVMAGAGDDQVFGGAEADTIFGDDGADRLFGGDDNDLIVAGAGNDTVFGGGGNDTIVAETGDGNDLYFGDESDGGVGNDTLDMTGVSADATVHLGNGPLAKGYAHSSETGADTLWGIENVNTGLGNDTITASNAVNVMDGGAGNDTFVFPTIQAANGDRIVSFEPGDKIDLSGIDADETALGNQSFTLVSGGAFTAAGQLSVSFENGVTMIRGNVGGNPDADFELEVEGYVPTNPNLTL